MISSVPAYRRQLESFIRAYVTTRTSHVEEPATWAGAAGLMTRNPALVTFRWLGVRVGGTVRVLGIRPLIEEPFFSLSALEQQGFRVGTKQYPVMVPPDVSAGHFWIAEIVSTEKVVVSAFRHVLPDKWHVLEEHILERRPSPLTSPAWVHGGPPVRRDDLVS